MSWGSLGGVLDPSICYLPRKVHAPHLYRLLGGEEMEYRLVEGV